MGMPDTCIHSLSELEQQPEVYGNGPVEVDTFDGKIFVEWDPDASVTPMGQLPFFIEFLKVGNRFDPWVKDCPLEYQSNNAPKKINLLGSLFLSILAGHTRYAHIRNLVGDIVNQQLLGMTKIVGDDSARRGLKKIEEAEGVCWLQTHLRSCYEPLLTTPWILDSDVTIKCLYGNQEGAVNGYNPKKPGRPSHTYHTYLIANLRLVLDVEVRPGNEAHSCHSLPGLLELLNRLPRECWPEFIRGDCDFGNDTIMSSLETMGQHYLFKLKKSKYVQELIRKHHGKGEWIKFSESFEAKESSIELSTWPCSRRVVIVRRRLNMNSIVGIEHQDNGQLSLGFIDGPEDIKAYEYAVLITNLDFDVTAIVQQYRDRADSENVFDEIKNQWGWGGYTTHDIKSCRFIARMIALIYNWWSLFARLADPTHHRESITSKPRLLTSVGRLTTSGRQKRMVISSHHVDAEKVSKLFRAISAFFKQVKAKAPQLTLLERWKMILERVMVAFRLGKPPDNIKRLAIPV